jgi:hypothetical protein
MERGAQMKKIAALILVIISLVCVVTPCFADGGTGEGPKMADTKVESGQL